jgi:transcriptional regulator with XRE-family HTH domain
VSLGPILARARKARGVQQKDLAAQMGLAKSTLSAWEGDHRRPDADQLRDLCRILHVSADVLLEREPFQLGPVPAQVEEPSPLPEARAAEPIAATLRSPTAAELLRQAAEDALVVGQPLTLQLGRRGTIVTAKLERVVNRGAHAVVEALGDDGTRYTARLE